SRRAAGHPRDGQDGRRAHRRLGAPAGRARRPPRRGPASPGSADQDRVASGQPASPHGPAERAAAQPPGRAALEGPAGAAHAVAAGVGTIQLSRGMIIGADSPNALDLREHFLTSPEVDPARRSVLATLPPEAFDDELVEGTLVARELAGRDEIERARIARIYS